MTEKRYTHNILGSVFKDGKLFALTEGESQARTLCIELNELDEENEKLKKEIKQTKKDFKQGLSVFEDIANANHQHFKLKVFNLIDNKIKLLNDCYMINEAKILNDLKEELLK